MNTRYIIRLILICSYLLPLQLVGQKKTDANLIGHVILKSTGEHLPFINISIRGTAIGTATDATGHYFLKNLPEGTFTVIASGMGYTTQEKEVILEGGKNVEIDFTLTEDAIQLSNVVVTASRNEGNRKSAAVVVNVISPKIFESTNSVCVAQGLNFQPGLRVETNCQNCGYQQVRINGLEGPYSQILIDSRPIFSSLAGVYGLEQIPASMVDRIEVLRGGGSALFGSNAIAGTINIITKEPKSNGVNLSNTTNLIGGEALDVNNSFNASVVSENNKAGIMFFGSTRNRDAWDANGDGFSEVTSINAKNIGFRSYYRTGNYSKLTVEYHNLGEHRRGGNKIDLQPHEADIAEQLEHDIHTGGIRFDLFDKDNRYKLGIYTSAQAIKRKSYYGAGQDLFAYGNTEDISIVSGSQFLYSFDKLIFLPADITIGAEYNMNELEDKIPGYNRHIRQNIQIGSLYAQNEWKNDQWSILGGARMDKHSLINRPIFSPRLNIRYNPISEIGLRASLSTGFRAPQAFDEDLHINIAGGEVMLIQLSPYLREERSISYSASADINQNFGSILTNFLIEGFYTNLANVFVLEDIGYNEDGIINFLRRNGSGAIVQGINLEGIVVPISSLQIQFGATFQTSEYVEPEIWSENVEAQKKMFRTPEQYAYLTSSYQFNKNTEVSVSGTYTGQMYVKHFAGYTASDRVVATPSFIDMNIKLNHEFKINGEIRIQLNGGVQNIFNSYQKDFDIGENRDAGYIYGPALPRTFFVGLKMNLN